MELSANQQLKFVIQKCENFIVKNDDGRRKNARHRRVPKID